MLPSNKLRSLPVQLSALKGLQQIDFSRNALESLPECFASMQKLKEISLAHNKLHGIPSSLCDGTLCPWGHCVVHTEDRNKRCCTYVHRVPRGICDCMQTFEVLRQPPGYVKCAPVCVCAPRTSVCERESMNVCVTSERERVWMFMFVSHVY